MDFFENTIKVMVVLLVVPVLAFFVSVYYENTINQEIQASLQKEYPDLAPELFQEFTFERILFDPENYGVFDFGFEAYVFPAMKYGSIITALVGFGLVLLVVLLSMLGRKNPHVLALVFTPTVTVAGVIIGFMTLAMGALLVGALYYGESALLGTIHGVIIALLGLGALVGVFSIFKALIIAFNPPVMEVDKDVLDPSHPLATLVQDVARTLEVDPPDYLVSGEAANFFVYQGRVKFQGQTKIGRVMYLSQDLAKRLTEVELKAIIAHEFAHFIAKDLEYTTKFQAGYVALGQAVSLLSQSADIAMVIARIPALFLFNFIHFCFGIVEKKNSRERELKADALAMGTYGVEPFVGGLTKITLLMSMLGQAQREVDATDTSDLDDGQLRDKVQAELEKLISSETPEERRTCLNHAQAHPFDTHPPLFERVKPAGDDGVDLVMAVRLKLA